MSEVGKVTTRHYLKTERELTDPNAETVRHFAAPEIDSVQCPKPTSEQTKYLSGSGAGPPW